MKKQISSKLVSLIFAILVICFAVGFYVFAWTGPEGDPPTGNVDAPINVGGVGQNKKGTLIVGFDGGLGFFETAHETHLAVIDGKVGIGTTGPTEKLDINGAMKLRGITGLAGSRSANTGYWYYYTTADPGFRFFSTGPNTTTRGFYKFITEESDQGGKIVPLEIQADGDVLLAQTTGNVGIGTTNPGSYRLNVSGDAYVSGDANATRLCIAGDCRDIWPSGNGGGGTVTGSGTANRITKWSGATSLTDSIMSESAGGITIGGGLIVDGPVAIDNVLMVDGMFLANSNAGVVGNLQVTGLSSCDTIDTDASGNLVCGTDATGAGGGVTGSGTDGNIPKWSGATGLTDSIMSETAGGVILVNGDFVTTSGVVVGGPLLVTGVFSGGAIEVGSIDASSITIDDGLSVSGILAAMSDVAVLGNLVANTVKAGDFISSSGSSGISITVEVTDAHGTSSCVIRFEDGLLVWSDCP